MTQEQINRIQADKDNKSFKDLIEEKSVIREFENRIKRIKNRKIYR